LQGSIGKSYAFETAQRYGISPLVVKKARELYGEDKENLEELIEKSTALEREMHLKIISLEKQEQNLQKKQKDLENLEEKMHQEQRKILITLENRYNAATKRAQQALKTKDSSDGRRLLNEAHKHKQKAKKNPKSKLTDFQVGDRVKYRLHWGDLLFLKAEEATIIVDGLKMRVPLSDLKKSVQTPPKSKIPKATSTVEKSGASVSIKLLGMFGDEAIEKVDKFLSDALLNGLNEVKIIHGTGSGILAKLVTEYLQNHPNIQKFYRVPNNLGATIVKL
jgi:DNA mismatch repair protein MutS2